MSELYLDVIGDPIAHSKSPMVHGMVMRELGISCRYERVLVRRGMLEEYVESAIRRGVAGFNLTMPHKADIIPYLAGIDRDAELFGSVNTVRIRGGKLYGYNTDARGFVLALERSGVKAAGMNVVILGAGGVVSTLALKLASEGAASVTVLNRTVSKAEAICASLEAAAAEGLVPVGCTARYGSVSEVSSYIQDCDILINATPLGMTGVDEDYRDLSFLDGLRKSAFVSDLIYSPPKTKFLAAAESRGIRYMNGLGMLIGQAILADEIYLDKSLNVHELFTKLTSADCEF